MTNKQALVKLCVDTVKYPKRVEQFSNGKDVDQKIREEFFSIMGTDKPNKKDIRRHKIEIFEILEEVLTETYIEGVEENAFFMQFVETRNLARGDKNEFYLPDDAILYVSEHSGDHWNISRQKLEGGTSFSVETTTYAIGVYTDFFRFVTGKVNFADFISKTADAIKRKIMEEVAASFQVGSTELPTQFRETGSYSEARLTDIYEHVAAATGSEPIVLGTKSALNQITAGTDVEWMSDNMKDELNATGRFAIYRGMRLVQLPQVHKSNTWDFAYDDKQLLILPATADKFIKVIFEGEDEIKENQDNQTNNDMSVEYKLLTNFGVKTIFSTLFGLYKLV